MDRDGASLATLYQNCNAIARRSLRAGYVLVVRDASPAGAVFGAYLTDAPHPSPHYYGTGECFLWRASVLPPAPPATSSSTSTAAPISSSSSNPASAVADGLAGLPPPPSADTTHMGRSTTIRGEKGNATGSGSSNTNVQQTSSPENSNLEPPGSRGRSRTPDPIRFKAFPYSGVNDYMIFCETGFLSLGGG